MKRAVSYSDSFLILEKNNNFLDGALTPILIPTSSLSPEQSFTDLQKLEQNQNLQIQQSPKITLKPSRSWKVLCFLFTFKGSFHLLLISAFETIFYFLYVNKSENDGILHAINTYYQPLVADCSTNWSNSTRWLIQEILTYELNQTQIDAFGNHENKVRLEYNQKLLLWSAMYSVACAGLCVSATMYVRWKKWIIPWSRMIVENFIFVLILGLYELFFFKTIIYNYDTLSTAELNKYIVDGLAQCAYTS
jgi:hypothetical protein